MHRERKAARAQVGDLTGVIYQVNELTPGLGLAQHSVFPSELAPDAQPGQAAQRAQRDHIEIAVVELRVWDQQHSTRHQPTVPDHHGVDGEGFRGRAVERVLNVQRRIFHHGAHAGIDIR